MRDARILEARAVTEYCCGFMIRPAAREVLLIQKQRPAFQKGLWNGIGGKLEHGETPLQAMTREFHEEAGVVTHPEDWEHTISLTGDSDEVQAHGGSAFAVYYFRAFVEHWPNYISMTDELVLPMAIDVDLWPRLENLKWILPLQTSLNIQFPLSVRWRRLS
jgi:8-oxo-dGTP diphosphatase